MVKQPGTSEQIMQLRVAVSQLQQVLRRMQLERERAAKLRRRRLLMVAVPVSLALHIALLVYLALMYRSTGDGEPGPPGVEFAILHDQDLTSLDELDFDDLLSEEAVDLSAMAIDTPSLDMDISAPAAELAHAPGGELETLGGAGDGLGGSGGLTPGGAGTTYFGIAGKGTRFAYIVDRSGSMAAHDRMNITIRELARSVQALPDYAYFYVLFFSSNIVEPPMQRGWVQARQSNVVPFVRWLNSVDPGGGTMPRESFVRIFELDVLPDVIYFMTDGIIAPQNLTAEEVARMNSRGRKVVIHTIAFGDQGSEELLRRISRESGGTYRYVPDRSAQ